MKLTAKQELFCKEYLVDLNATQAAIRALYSVKTSQRMGSENLSKPVIQECIQQLMDKRSKKVEITAEWVLTGIKETTEQARDSDDPTKAYKGYELAGRHLKMFTDKKEITGKDGDPFYMLVQEISGKTLDPK